jgi:hypothetical protein
MVIHFAYRQELFAHVDEYDRGVQTLTGLGWRISQATGPDNGPFAVLFRKDDATSAVTTRQGSSYRGGGRGSDGSLEGSRYSTRIA